MQETKQIHARGSFESCNLAWKSQNINDESVLLLTVLETRILCASRASFSRLSPLEFCFYTWKTLGGRVEKGIGKGLEDKMS